jgi:2-polyprenyl-3-methyl-5-hydroxy-6-metoxy-1,4-benzoquinol methylase
MNEQGQYKCRIKDDPKTARQYRQRKPRRHAAEMALVKRALSAVPMSNRVLDIPCGAGRVTILLAKMGYTCVGAEIADAMIDVARQEIAKESLPCTIDKIDIEDMSYSEKAFGAIICFRIFHHFPGPDVRRRVIRELCRVAENYVALSYLHPFSLTSLKRKARAALGGKRSRQNTNSLKEVKQYFQECGFVLVKDYAQFPVIRSLHLALFKRQTL